jgi:hypothetical protein
LATATSYPQKSTGVSRNKISKIENKLILDYFCGTHEHESTVALIPSGADRQLYFLKTGLKKNVHEWLVHIQFFIFSTLRTLPFRIVIRLITTSC